MIILLLTKTKSVFLFNYTFNFFIFLKFLSCPCTGNLFVSNNRPVLDTGPFYCEKKIEHTIKKKAKQIFLIVTATRLNLIGCWSNPFGLISNVSRKSLKNLFSFILLNRHSVIPRLISSSVESSTVSACYNIKT
jgi:hypothetical protein